VCHDLTYQSRQKSGSLFYKLIERPMKIHDKALAALKHSRVSMELSEGWNGLSAPEIRKPYRRKVRNDKWRGFEQCRNAAQVLLGIFNHGW
jgi:hypothetical protein